MEPLAAPRARYPFTDRYQTRGGGRLLRENSSTLRVIVIFAGILVVGEAVFLLYQPFNLSLQRVGLLTVATLGLVRSRSGDTALRPVRIALLILLGVGLWSCAVALWPASQRALSPSDLGFRGGWLRPAVQLFEIGEFAYVTYGVIHLLKGSLHAAFVRGLLMGGRAISVYAGLSWLSRSLGWIDLPRLGNNPLMEHRQLASFQIESEAIPRASGSFGEPKGLAWFLILLLAVELFVWLRTRSGRKQLDRQRYASFVWIGIHTSVLIVTFSTGGWVSVIIFGLTALLFRSQQDGFRVGLAVGALVIGGILILLGGASFRAPAKGAEANSIIEARISNSTGASLQDHYGVAISAYAQRPVLGWGLGQYPFAIASEEGTNPVLGYAHAGFYLSTLVESGAIAIPAMVVAFTLLFRGLLLAKMTPTGRAIALALLTAWMVRAIEIGHLDGSFALAIALGYLFSQTSEGSPSPRSAA